MLAWWFDPKKLIHHCTQQFMKRKTMHYLKRRTRKNGEDGVSPVVGVMLMLVVTIIIAAVVSAFSGGLTGGTQKAPSANVEIHIVNSGTAATSYFSMKVLGVSDPISTKNLKVVTSWTATNSSGFAVTGGNTTYANLASASSMDDTTYSSFSVPTGYGNGVNGFASNTLHVPAAQWGNFTLSSGTATSDSPSSDYGNTTLNTPQYQYPSAHIPIDPMQAILGGQWNALTAGNVVSVRIIDISSGKEIVDQQVPVEV
jgi:FlaG/FlaF family flagellin (archaellin)